MRDRRVRAVFVALILIFPGLMIGMGRGHSPRGSRPSLLTWVTVEVVLAGGLLAVAYARRRLRAERRAAAVAVYAETETRRDPSVPHDSAGAARQFAGRIRGLLRG